MIITKCWHMFCSYCIKRNLGATRGGGGGGPSWRWQQRLLDGGACGLELGSTDALRRPPTPPPKKCACADSRHRKCPGCGVSFGAGDVHPFYFT